MDYCLYGTQVEFGVGVASKLPEALKSLGCERPAILVQRRLYQSHAWANLYQLLKVFNPIVLSDVPNHGDLGWVEATAKQLLGSQRDCIVAIGGGSVSDTAKALSMLLAEGGHLVDHATQFIPPSTVVVPQRTKPKLPIISLPTMASGAEVTPSFGIRSGAQKLLFWDRSVASRYVLIDPEVGAEIPLRVLQQTAMNGLAHCFEGLYSLKRSVIAEAFALKSVELFAGALKQRAKDDLDVRAELLLAGHLSGLTLSTARTCLHHAICHVIGARHQVSHGAVNAVLLPHALRFNEVVAHDLLAPALKVLNQQSAVPWQAVSDWVAEQLVVLGLAYRLSDFGICARDLPAIAEQTMHERGLAFNPRRVTGSNDVLSILETAL